MTLNFVCCGSGLINECYFKLKMKDVVMYIS